MPELPEVETVVRGLRRTIVGETIARVEIFAPPSSIQVSASFDGFEFAQVLADRNVLEVTRRGKNILIQLSGGLTLWVHLKMTGRFFHIDRSAPVDKHDLAVFTFKSTLRRRRDRQLRFNDYRRFGRLRLFPTRELWDQEGLKNLGPEPLELDRNGFVELCRRRPRMIKPALLDQSFLAGLGNIYADESLYASRLHPRRITPSISAGKLGELHGHIQRLLKKAICLMGTTVNSYTGLNGRTGRFQQYLLAYGREGEPCHRCRTKIARQKIGSRSAHFCPRCQRSR